MRCEDVERLLADGATAELEAEEARAHLRSCAECRALRQAEVTAPHLSRKVEAAVRRIVHQDLRPLRPLPSDRVLVAAGVALLAALAGGLSLLFGRPSGWIALTVGNAVVLVVFTMLVAGLLIPALIWSIVPASSFRWRPALPLLFFAAGYPVVAAVLFPHGAARGFVVTGVPCLASGLVVALAASALIVGLARNGYAANWSSTGALLGGSGALVGFLVLQLHCPMLEAWHLAVWHGLIIMIPIGAGLVAGRLYARIR